MIPVLALVISLVFGGYVERSVVVPELKRFVRELRAVIPELRLFLRALRSL